MKEDKPCLKIYYRNEDGTYPPLEQPKEIIPEKDPKIIFESIEHIYRSIDKLIPVLDLILDELEALDKILKKIEQQLEEK